MITTLKMILDHQVQMLHQFMFTFMQVKLNNMMMQLIQMKSLKLDAILIYVLIYLNKTYSPFFYIRFYYNKKKSKKKFNQNIFQIFIDSEEVAIIN